MINRRIFMQSDTSSLFVSSTFLRRETFRQVAAVFEGEGGTVNASLEALLRPLLDGTMDYAEHRAMLEAMLKGLGA
jgi:hypothetical protein